MEFNNNYWNEYLAREEVVMDAKQIADTKSNIKNGKSKQRLQDVMLVGKICEEMETTVNDLSERLEQSEDQVHSLENRVEFLEKCREEREASYRKERDGYKGQLEEERTKNYKLVRFLKDNKEDKNFARVLWKLQDFWHNETGELLL